MIKPAAVALSRAMHGDKLARELMELLPDASPILAQDIKCQLVDRVKKGKYTSQLDDSTDISNSAQLIVFVRYSFDGKLNAVLLPAGGDLHR